MIYRAAFTPRSYTARLWLIPEIRLITSVYAIDEARRNLISDEHHERLTELLAVVDVRDDDLRPLPDWVILPEKDRPILEGAIAARATHLLTNDRRHFGCYFWQIVEGITILPSSVYLKRKLL